MRKFLIAVLLLGCGNEESPSTDEPTETPSVEAPAPDEAEAEPQGALEPSGPAPVDVAGLEVTVVPEGGVRVAGTDRWGADISTTYESWQYLRDAMPTLERSITPEQAAALGALVDAHAPAEAAAAE